METHYKYAVLYHCYYSIEHLKSMIKKVNALNEIAPVLLLASVSNDLDIVLTEKESKNLVCLKTSNLGKDIGGKFVLLDLLMTSYNSVEYIAFSHDKKSYYKHSGDFERIQLNSILQPELFIKIMEIFEQKKNAGIICNKNVIKNEYDSKRKIFLTKNNELIKNYLTLYNINISDYRFVAGTMFWIRSSVLKDFFAKNEILEIRSTMEQGNVLDHKAGSITHTWERLLSFINTSKGFKIIGI